jgi:hypothetical protein
VDKWYIDYSAKRLTGSVIKSTAVGPAGEHPSGVIRYIDAPEKLQTKHVDQGEYASLKAAGLELPATYFEIGYEDPNGGYAGGQANARRALAGADWLGFKGIILMCCDRWFVQAPHSPVTAARWQAYLDGAVSVLGRGRTGAYGFSDAMDAARGHVDYFVQCGARSAVRPFVHGWQDNNYKPSVGGISTDRVLILQNFPAAGGGSTAPTTPSAPQTSEDELMERITVGSSQTDTSFRVKLSGGPNAGIVIRPVLDAAGAAPDLVYVPHIYAWKGDETAHKAGIGYDPGSGGDVTFVRTPTRFPLPGATWADVVYSSSKPFEVDCF